MIAHGCIIETFKNNNTFPPHGSKFMAMSNYIYNDSKDPLMCHAHMHEGSFDLLMQSVAPETLSYLPRTAIVIAT